MKPQVIFKSAHKRTNKRRNTYLTNKKAASDSSNESLIDEMRTKNGSSGRDVVFSLQTLEKMLDTKEEAESEKTAEEKCE